MQAKITKRNVEALHSGQSISDTEVRGFRVRRLPSGVLSYEFRYRKPNGKRAFLPLGLHGSITADQARDLAKKRSGEVADNRDPVAERDAKTAVATNTVDKVLDDFVARYMRKQALRSADEIERSFNAYVRPRIGSKSIYELRRSDIVQMLNGIEDENGPVMADRVLAYLRRAFNWQAMQDDRFSPPIVKGMARTKSKERARSRTLDDQEIRDLWTALDQLNPGIDAPPCYPTFMRVLLLTAQRREEVARMHRDEIAGDDCWTIPAARSKTKLDQLVPVTAAVKALIGDVKGFVFSNERARKRPFSGFSKAKKALDAGIAKLRKREGRKPMPHWVNHDLRRTARSLLSRAGVSADIAERVLGHVIPGVRGVYDRYEYLDEKRDALEKLAALVDRILHPGEAVVTFPKRRRP
jgi:integrase